MTDAPVQVALDTPLDRLFDYLTPAPPPIGTLVEVPFGRTHTVGVVVGHAPAKVEAARLKPLLRVLTDRPPVPADVLALARFCAHYYHAPLGAVLAAALPPRLRDPAPMRVRADWLVLTDTGREHAPPARARAQCALHAELALAPLERSMLAARGQSRAAAALVKTGLAAWRATPPPIATPPAPAEPSLALTACQCRALAGLAPTLGRHVVHLVQGVTGSGKTELYLRLIAQVLERGGQALVLVPEIALTPQLEAAFRRRFPGRRLLAVHSGRHAERIVHALDPAATDVLIGTRLAVFSALPRLGLIVVDEEHDASYKQQDGVRYSARDLAIWRAQQAGCPVVLGSATPSLESYAQAVSGRYVHHRLDTRAHPGARLPRVGLVDTRRLAPDAALAPECHAALAETLARGEQALVFINRRGFAPALYCPACTWVAPCPHCAARLVWHRAAHALKCHHCGHTARVPTHCPDCGNADLVPLGQGTQRIEALLAASYPQARIRRIDRDTTQPGAWVELGETVRAGEVDLLVGTQMLAKGHDFPAMTLAVVLDADGLLFSPDFRATERLFAQLMQVAGRAGRGDRPGRVLIQTAFPEHPLFQHLARQDFDGYARVLLDERRALDLPPFSRLAILRAEAPEAADALAFLETARSVCPNLPGVRVNAPAPAGMPRLAGLARAQLVVQSADRPALHSLLRAWRPSIEAIRPRVARWALDIDPAGV